MKEVLYSRQTLLNIEDSISELVRQNYFSNEDYAVQYVSDILQYFSLNFYNLVATNAPEYFNQYSIGGHNLKFLKYNKNSRTTWYAFFEELESIFSINYLANNHFIGQHLSF